jgi:hypothetical protein
MVDPDLIEVNVNDWFGGVAATAYGEWWQNYGRGREIRPDDPNQGIAQTRLPDPFSSICFGREPPRRGSTRSRKFHSRIEVSC